MYEIWLAMNIVWEIALTVWPVLLIVAAVWAALMLIAWRRPGTRWKSGLPLALLAGVVIAAVAFLMVPGWTRSSLGELRYWVDWANLLGVAVGFGAVGAALAWPLSAMRRRDARL